MNYLDLLVRQPDEWLHPMQRFIRETDVVEYEELLTWNLRPEADTEYEFFYVEADREPYRARVESVDSIRWYELTPIDEQSFYVFACQETREADRNWRRAFARLELVVVPPVVVDEDAAFRLTVVGARADLGGLLDALPESVQVEVNAVGEFDRRHASLAGQLTDRQLETLAAAVDVGFYAVPREGTLSDVAAELAVAESTASNHLRKAEATVMRRLVSRYGRARYA